MNTDTQTALDFCTVRDLDATVGRGNLLRMFKGVRNICARLCLSRTYRTLPCMINGTTQGPCDGVQEYTVQTPAQERTVHLCTAHAARCAWNRGKTDAFADVATDL